MSIEDLNSSGEDGPQSEKTKNPLEDMPTFEEHLARIEQYSEQNGFSDKDPRSFYESNDIQRNPNGDLILDPKARLLPSEGFWRPSH